LSEYVFKQEFKAKNALILLKNRKDHPSLGDPPPNSPIHSAAGGTLKPPQLP